MEMLAMYLFPWRRQPPQVKAIQNWKFHNKRIWTQDFSLEMDLEGAYFPTFLPKYETYFLQTWLPRWNPNITSVEVHPQLSNNGHPVDGSLVGAGIQWPYLSE